ncbi:hypothetical protein LWI29_027815 [Acer saccharum]|uniref:BURP domain-containing protein n=1 Tax=Acer saccharum TaxID=4024 RepID=A0AA39RII7_ACESA|nr:hypothetical protein LWI29_027815 [Acer saccharum]
MRLFFTNPSDLISNAKILAIAKACELLGSNPDLARRRIIIVSDCKTAVDCVKKRGLGGNSHDQTIQYICNCLDSFGLASVDFSPRVSNQFADSLAKKGAVSFVAARDLKGVKENHFTPKAHLTQYWNKKINTNLPESHFLLSKASSPILKAADIANFAKLATAQNNNQLPLLLPGGIMFNIYGPYEDYAKNDINFINYFSNSSESETEAADPPQAGEKGAVMPMPDITNKMPETTFLPRTTVNEIPFSSSKLSEMKKLFNASDNSAMERIIKEALKDCERKPNKGETKRCVASAEDMIDFATSVLGRDVALRKTENNKGSKQDILIGSVKRINGGKAVSCHQKLCPCFIIVIRFWMFWCTKRIFWIRKQR